MNAPLIPATLPELPSTVREHFESMSRRPDIDSADLRASDQADVLGSRILHQLMNAEAARADKVLVLNDSYGALAGAAAVLGVSTIYSFQDRLSQELAAQNNFGRIDFDGLYEQLSMAQLRCPDPELQGALAQVDLVLVKLPRAHEELAWLAWAAAHLCPQATLVALGLQKYMTLSQNTVLERYFERVNASRGFGKARALIAYGPIQDVCEPWQQESHDVSVLPQNTLELSGGAAAFGSARLDPGSRFLIDVLAQEFQPTPGAHIVDLGCGNGTLAVAVALLHPAVTVTGVDQSESAVVSTRRSAELNHVADRVTARRMDALSEYADQSLEHILLNPPFHSGHAVDTAIATKLFRDAARVLSPGGTLWCVWNSSLRYRPELEHLIGATQQVGRNPKFTVTVSHRR